MSCCKTNSKTNCREMMVCRNGQNGQKGDKGDKGEKGDKGDNGGGDLINIYHTMVIIYRF
jgi:hypothetical protein